MSLLDIIGLHRILQDGTPVNPTRKDVNFIGATVEDDPAHGRTNVTFDGGGGGGAVSSVFGRVGAVVAVASDYAASLISNDSGVMGSTVKVALETLAAAIATNTSNIGANTTALGTKLDTAGAGLTQSGTTVNVAAGDGSISVAADAITVGVISDVQHGNRGGGALHADVVAGGASGFMSGTDKTILDSLVAGAAPLPLLDVRHSPLGHWILGSTPTVDLSGNSKTLTGSASAVMPSLDYVNQSIQTGGLLRTDSAFQLFGAVSGECVVCPASISALQVLMAYGGNGETLDTNFAWYLSISSTGLLEYLHETGAGTNHFVGGGKVLVGQWLHLAFTRDAAGTGVKLYTNGLQCGAGTTALAPAGATSAQLGVMRSPEAAAGAFTGAAAMVAIYNSELSAAQILALAKRRLRGIA
jgi:Concanavalin A-like lectin/glucanases superfamily